MQRDRVQVQLGRERNRSPDICSRRALRVKVESVQKDGRAPAAEGARVVGVTSRTGRGQEGSVPHANHKK